MQPGDQINDLREQVRQLAAEAANLLHRLAQIEERLRTTASAEIPVAPEPAAIPPPLPEAWAPPVPPEPTPPQLEPLPAPQEVEQRVSPRLETQVGLNWINRVGVVTLILAAGFFFKYAVDNQWIGPTLRIVLGVLAALLALGVGEWLSRRGQRIFAQGITALGIALLYLSFYASFNFYRISPQGLTFVLMVLTTIAAGGLALRYGSIAIAALGLAGGYLTPILLSTGEDRVWFLLSYVFVLNLGALVLARKRAWPALEYLAAAGTFLTYWGAGNLSSFTRDQSPLTAFAVLFYIQFASSGASPVWAAAQILAPSAAAVLWSAPQNQFLLLQYIFSAGGLAVSELRGWRLAPPWTLVSYWVVGWFWLQRASPDSSTFPLLTLGFLIFLCWTPWRAVIRKHSLRLTDAALIPANAAAYFVIAYGLVSYQGIEFQNSAVALLSLSLGVMHALLAKLLWDRAKESDSGNRAASLATVTALFFLTLAIPFYFAGFRITIAWALEAAALAWLARKWNDWRAAVASWVVFLFVAARLAGFDSTLYAHPEDYSAIVNARFLTFLVSCVAMWIATRFSRDRMAAAALYIAGHGFFLWSLGMELLGVAQRTVEPQNLQSTELVGISILMALYAAALVSIGVVTRTVFNRVLGLVLIGLVVLKLYLMDVWALQRSFRIAAFAALGVLLLAISYLYSHFRGAIERLVREKPSD